MKVKVRAHLTTESIIQFFLLIPERKRSQVIRWFLLNDYQLPNEAAIDKLTQENELERRGIDLFLNHQSISILDNLVNELRELISTEQKQIGVEVNRSLIFQHIVNQLNIKYKDNPLSSGKSKMKPFYVPKSHKAKLLQYINKREITSTLENYITEHYSGPEASEETKFKNKPTEELEIIQLSLDEFTINELDDYANQYSANRSQILRNVVEQLVRQLEDKNDSVEGLVKNRLDEMVNELKSLATEDQIMEAIQNYKINQ
jgi:metal-responsive CopG/Arc/MetJ family transcriptional regulator